MSDEKPLTKLVEDAVNQGATTAEEIHRAIANLPVAVLEGLGLFESATREVKRIQDVSLGVLYDTIRRINHEVAELAGEVLEERGKARRSTQHRA